MARTKLKNPSMKVIEFRYQQTKSPVIALILLISLVGIGLASAQYNYQNGMSHASGGYGDTGGGGHGSGMDDDRPKVNLGIRLRIPAFKFELPRFNLPKITVSAKIRQPEGPRVIQLPEINLDTSSKSELPGSKGGGGGGAGSGYDSHYQGPAYGMGASSSYGEHDKTGMISFTTEEEPPTHYDQHQTMAYKTSYSKHGTQYGHPQSPRYNYQPQQQRQQPSYASATNAKQTYWARGGAASSQPTEWRSR